MNLVNKIYVLLLVVTTLAVLVSCSPKAGKNILAFFFDGVPQPAETNTGMPSDSLI